MNIVVKRLEETNISYKQLVDLMHASFEERLQQGLNFSCSFITIEDFKKKADYATILVAVDSEKDLFLGFVLVRIIEGKRGNYAFAQDLSVSPNAKRCGVGSKLESALVHVALEKNCKCIECTTAVEAKSSVKFHLKQGYKIIGLDSFPNTNYYSYIFRMNLKRSIWDYTVFCKILFAISYLKTHLTKNKNGTRTFVGRLFEK